MKKAIIKDIDAYIKENNMDISIEKIASKLKVTKETIITWRYSPGNMSLEQAEMLSKILKVKYDDLFIDLERENIDISSLNSDDLMMISSMLHANVRDNRSRVEGIISRNQSKNQVNDIISRLEFIRVRILGLSKADLSKQTGINYDKADIWTQNKKHKISDYITISALSCISLDYILNGDNLAIIDLNISAATYDAIKNMVVAFNQNSNR